MARVILGPMVSDARGKEGGLVFSRNTYGHYTRAKVSPVQPNTQLQQLVRQAMTYLAQRWRETLTPEQRATWAAYAKATTLTDRFGAKFNLSPIAIYLRYNVEMRNHHGIILDEGPPVPGHAPMTKMTITGTDVAGVTVTELLPGVNADEYVEVYAAAAAMSQARNFFNGPWQWRRSISTGQPCPQEIVPPEEVQIGTRWFLRCRRYDATGRVSPPMTGFVDIAA